MSKRGLSSIRLETGVYDEDAVACWLVMPASAEWRHEFGVKTTHIFVVWTSTELRVQLL